MNSNVAYRCACPNFHPQLLKNVSWIFNWKLSSNVPSIRIDGMFSNDTKKVRLHQCLYLWEESETIRYIAIHAMQEVIGEELCSVIIALHFLTGLTSLANSALNMPRWLSMMLWNIFRDSVSPVKLTKLLFSWLKHF